MAIIGDVEPVTSREAQVCGVLYTVLREPGALPHTRHTPGVGSIKRVVRT